jgi:hypothetical protein
MISEILVVALIKVGCRNQSDIQKCADAVAECYEKGLNSEEVKRYETEYRKAFVITKCIDKANNKDGMHSK